MNWSQTFLDTLKGNDVRLVTYVPDNVLRPLIAGATADNYFRTVGATREDDAVGMIAGSWMGGVLGCVMMQTSGFGTLANAIASLLVPYQIPGILIVSERGVLGEFNSGQALVARTMRPVLDSIAVTHHTLDDENTMAFVVDRSIKQAVATQSPVVLILSPLLTGGKVFKPS
jgi:sulfopyruvate decarboxylase TPP-binding subunit